MAAGNLIVDAKLFFISQKMTANTAVICNENSSLEKITWIKKDGKNTAGHFHFARVIVNTMTLPSTRRAVTQQIHSHLAVHAGRKLAPSGAGKLLVNRYPQVFTPHVVPWFGAFHGNVSMDFLTDL